MNQKSRRGRAKRLSYMIEGSVPSLDDMRKGGQEELERRGSREGRREWRRKIGMENYRRGQRRQKRSCTLITC